MTKTAILQKIDLEAPLTSIRTPKAKDAIAIRQLIKKTGKMDVNSEYAYMLLGEHFKETCAITEEDREIVGFVSAYVPPNQLDVLFVWQIAVHENCRKRGLGCTMFHEILKRKPCENIKYIHATISSSNIASRSLFISLARDLGTDFYEQLIFPADYFSDPHEEESLFVIGPLTNFSK